MGDDSYSTIEDLPEEVLIQIFAHLSPKLLKVASLVCTRWRNVINTTTELLAPFKLNLTMGSLSQATGLARRLQSLKINTLLEPKVHEILESYKIRSLELSDCTVDRKTLAESLQKLKFLETFSAENVKLQKTDFEPIDLTNLQNLRILYSTVEILEVLKTKNLKSFSFVSAEHSTDPELITQLLTQQPKLEHLKIIGTLKSDLCSCAENFPFTLKSLEVEKVDLLSVTETFTKFLSNHQFSLRELSITCPLKDSVITFILEHLKSLKKLKMIFTSTNRPTSTESQLKNVEEIELRGTLSFMGFKKLLSVFPSLKSVNVRNFFIRHFHLRNSVHLRGEINYLNFLRENGTLKNGISEFHADTIGNEYYFKDFLAQHAETLEVITITRIKDDEFTRGTVVDGISKCKKLKILRFSSESPIVTRMLSKITLDQPWTLESVFKVGRNKEIKLVFRFPDDWAVFREQCRTWDDHLIRDFSTSSNYGLNAFINKFK